MITGKNKHYGALVGAVTLTVFFSQKITDKDVNKPVTIVEAQPADRGPVLYKLAEADDEIHGFISSVETGTQGGLSWGGILEAGYVEGQDTSTLPPGTIVAVDTVPALGTAGAAKFKAVGADAPMIAWMVADNGVLKRI